MFVNALGARTNGVRIGDVAVEEVGPSTVVDDLLRGLLPFSLQWGIKWNKKESDSHLPR